MSSGSIFDSEQQQSGSKTWLIAVIAFIALAGSAAAIVWYNKPAGRSYEDVSAEEIRDTTVQLLDYSTFSGDEFRQQVLGRGRLERYVRVTNDVYFTYPEAGDDEFDEFLAKYFYDKEKIEYGKLEDGVVELGGYKLTVSAGGAHLFRTRLENIRIDPKQILSFPYSSVNYTASLGELKNLSNNSLLYGGKLVTRVPDRKNRPMTIFANHGIMVAKPDEPTLRRLVDELLKDTGLDREARIQRLVDFVANEIDYSWSEAVGGRETLKRASETLMTRSGDCSNKTILLASLLEQIGEEYILLYCPRHITVAVPQGSYANENKLDFSWSDKSWLIAETTLPGFQVGKTRVQDSATLTLIEYVQDPKNSDVIFDASSYAVLKFL